MTLTSVSFAGDKDTKDLNNFTCKDIMRFSGEHEFSPTVALRAGVNLFYGWAMWKIEESLFMVNPGGTSIHYAEVSPDGPHWGIGASVGGSMRFQHFTLEPFITGGYHDLNLDGDGVDIEDGILDTTYTSGVDESEWFIGAGFSLLFDMP